MLSTNQQRRIYLAGIVDGEGSITIYKRAPQTDRGGITPTYVGDMKVEMTHEPTVRLLQETFGGSVYRRQRNGGKPLYCWHVVARLAREALKGLLPYLSVKREQAELVLDLRPSAKGTIQRPEVLDEKERALRRIRELNS